MSFVLDSLPYYLADGQTLVAVAPSITISGTSVSLDTAGDYIVDRTHTENLQTSTMIGAQMLAGIGGRGNNASMFTDSCDGKNGVTGFLFDLGVMTVLLQM